MKFLSFFLFVFLFALACGRTDDNQPIPDPDTPKEVSIDGYLVISLIQKGSSNEYSLRVDTVKVPGAPVAEPTEPYQIVSQVSGGQIIKIE